MNNPLVSVVIPTYNRTGELIKRSLPSVMNKTYKNLEIIVVGDGTEQETVDAMAKITDPRVLFTNLPHYRQEFSIPDQFTCMAMIAVGYQTEETVLNDELKELELARRERTPLGDHFFERAWGSPIQTK